MCANTDMYSIKPSEGKSGYIVVRTSTGRPCHKDPFPTFKQAEKHRDLLEAYFNDQARKD